MRGQCDRSASRQFDTVRPTPVQARIMTAALLLRPAPLPGFADLVMAAARCWRAARDGGLPVQQRLHALLSRRGFDMLAPVFDSLMTLYEAMLGRNVVTGQTEPSGDESLLLGLLEGSCPRCGAIGCEEGLAASFDGAIVSTRIMVTLAETENRDQERAPPFAARKAMLAASGLA